MIRYEFEDIKHILYKQAYKIKREIQDFYPNKYEMDELVNEVWLKGSIQKLDNIKYIAARSYWDMIDYIRSVDGNQFKRKDKLCNKFKFRTNMHNIKISHDSYDDQDLFQNISNEGRDGINSFIDNDEAEYYLKGINIRKRDILRKYFLEQKNLKEISKELNLNATTISNYKKAALDTIRRDHDIDIEPKKEVPLEEILPEYVVDFEIDNDFSTNEESLLEK